MVKLLCIIFFTVSISAFSEIEFEEVLTEYNNKDINYINKMYFHGDSVLVYIHQYTNDDSSKTQTFLELSTNAGNNWKNLNDYFESSNVHFHDLFSEQLFSFLVSDKSDSTVKFINIEGKNYKSIKHPFKSGNPEIEIIPKDPNFIGVHFKNYTSSALYYRDRYFYTLNDGVTWDSISPEIQFKEISDEPLENNRLINNIFNYRDPSKSIFRYDMIFLNRYPYSITANYNIYTKKFDFYSGESYFGKYYGCFEVDEVMNITNKEDSIVIYNYETESYKTFRPVKSTLGWDNDSIGELGENISYKGIKVNTLNPNHHIIYISHSYSNRFNSTPPFIYQYYFQSHDSGKSWELLFVNDDIDYQVKDFFINPYNYDLWIVKGTREIINDFRIDVQSLFKSKYSTISSVKESTQEEYQVNIIDENIILNSYNSISDCKVSLFDLNGNEIFNSYLDIHPGQNIINIDRILNSGIYIVLIANENRKDEVVKVINVK